MKRNLSIFGIIIFLQVGFICSVDAQNTDLPKKHAASVNDPYVGPAVVMAPPPPPTQVEGTAPDGGWEAYKKNLAKRITYPIDGIKAKAEGVVYVSFLVDPKGMVTNVKVDKDEVGYGCGEEVVKGVNAMTSVVNWKLGWKKEQNSYVIVARFEKKDTSIHISRIGDSRNQDLSDPITEYFDETPEAPGGQTGYYNYLAQNIRYPDRAMKAGAQGTVYVSIVVNLDGTLSDVKLQRDQVGNGCGEESVRVIKAMPNWKPGKVNGKPVRCRYVVPVKFVIK